MSAGMQFAGFEPLFDVNPLTGTTVEVFFADRSLETFGRCGAGWFWWARRRGYSPAGSATGPFATCYAAYRHAMTARCPLTERFANKALLAMCQTWDMDLLTPDDIGSECAAFTGIS